MSTHKRNLLLTAGLIIFTSAPTAYFLGMVEAKRAMAEADIWINHHNHDPLH